MNSNKRVWIVVRELLKGLAAICMLVSILATIAMIADLYFNNSFVYLKKILINEPYLPKDKISNNNRDQESENKPIFEIFDDEPDPKTKEIDDYQPKVVKPEVVYSNKVDVKIEEDTASPPPSVKDDEADQTQPHISEKKSSKEATITKNIGSSKKEVSKSPIKDNLPKVAIIIDDIGFDPKIADDLIKIDKNITISILPGSPSGREIAKKMHSKGVEIMLHLPMEPVQYPSVDPGYGAILSSMGDIEIIKVLNKNLDILPQIRGVNNHMGSKLTTSSSAMRQIFTILKQKELFFIDSLTSDHSVAKESAEFAKLEFASRDLFLDNKKDKNYIKKKLKELIVIAKYKGSAIAIGHPYKETYLVLKEDFEILKKSVKIVPASQLVTQM
ncbi:MAG: divergent polysaccharide deacetylase family protein [Desulfamplus sp.]|nr:divergent polysaccharide deacetylase family protein [Desulfamplus sp.]